MTLRNAFGDLALDSTLASALEQMERLMSHIGVLSAVRDTNGSLRVNVANTAAVTISSGTVTTVTTVGTVTNQTQTGGYPTNQVVPAAQNLIAHTGNVAFITGTP